jgi:hypothetical protein
VLVFSESGEAMTLDERRALREKHYNFNGISCAACVVVLPGTIGWKRMSGMAQHAHWPCDAIKVLDAYERLVKESG